MNLEELRQQPHLSISAANGYIDFGLHYKLSRVDRSIPELKADVLAFGTSMHRALQDDYQHLLEGYRMTPDETQIRFGKCRRQSVTLWHDLSSSSIKQRAI